MDRQVPVLVKKDLVCFQIQEIVFHFSIFWRHLVQQRGMNLSLWGLLNEEFQRAFEAGIPFSALYPS